MPKIKKIKEIPSKIKIIEPSKEKSELEDEIEEEELENFADFVQGSSSTGEEITSILAQSNIGQRIITTQTAEESRTEDISPVSDTLYESMSRSAYNKNSEAYNPSLRAGETTGSTSSLSQNLVKEGSVTPRSLFEETAITREQAKEERREQYTRPQEGGRARRSRPQEGG